MRALWKRADGTSAVEMGLVLPLLMVILLGIIDYGGVFFVRLTMTNAAREGARVGVTQDAADAQAKAVAKAQAYLASANITNAQVVATTPTNANPTVTVTVTVDPYQPLVPFVLVPTPNRMVVSASMRWELAPTASGP